MTTLQTLDVSSGFRTAMRRLASTVSVVTCADEDGWDDGDGRRLGLHRATGLTCLRQYG
jgi:hypothetical protein